MNDFDQPYRWDTWHEKALAAGMKETTAQAGRALMRECVQHTWDRYMGPGIRKLCGWEDEGANMLAFGLAHPEMAEKLWRFLEEDDAGSNPRSRTPKGLQPLIMQSFSDEAFPLDLSFLPSHPGGTSKTKPGREGKSL